MSSTSNQTGSTPTGTYCVIPLSIPVPYKVCRYYRGIQGPNGMEWEYVGGSPVVLRPDSGATVIRLAPGSLVAQLLPDTTLWDSNAILVAAFVKAIGAPPNTLQSCPSAVPSPPDNDWAIAINAPISGTLGVLLLFGTVDSSGNVTKLVSSVDPEIQN